MATVTIRPDLNPRLVIVDLPFTELTVQETVNLCRDWEDSEEGMSYKKLIAAAGKEELGGGVSVGITATLQNAQIYFTARSTPLSTSGTCSTASPSGEVCVSLSSTFISDGVVRGDNIYNSTTRAMATVLSVDSETQVTHLPLTGGSRNDWQVSDNITTYNQVQCSISGGNLVAIDGAGAELEPILESALTQVVRTASSSATTQELADIQYASFGGGLWVDVTSPVSGVDYPTGTERQPVNNLADAKLIADSRGFNTFYIIGDVTISSGIDYSNNVFWGQGQNLSVITIDPSVNVTNCTFGQATLTGTLDGDSHIEECIISSLNFVSGIIERCILDEETIVLAGSEPAHFINCQSGVPGVSTPTIDMGGSGQALAIRSYNGGIKLANKTGIDSVSVDLNSGQVVLASTVTNGVVVARGVGKLIDESGNRISSGTWNGVTILNETIDSKDLQLARKLASNKVIISTDNSTTTIYDDDDLSVLWTFNHGSTHDRTPA